MYVAVRDASLVTKRNRNKAVNAYKTDFNTQINAAGNAKQGLTSPGQAGAETVAQAKLGCIACTIYNNNATNPNPDANQTLYPFNPSAGGAGRSY